MLGVGEGAELVGTGVLVAEGVGVFVGGIGVAVILWVTLIIILVGVGGARVGRTVGRGVIVGKLLGVG